MADKKIYSQQSYESFITWLGETYPDEDFVDPIRRQMIVNEQSQQYQYWINYFWKPTHSYVWDKGLNDYVYQGEGNEPPLPKADVEISPITSTFNTSGTSGFKSPLPSTLNIGGVEQPVNYMVFGSFTEKRVAPYEDDFMDEDGNYDSVAFANAKKEYNAGKDKKVYMYVPFPALENINQSTINDIYQNIYGVYDNGEVYNNAIPFTPQDMAGIIPYNATTQQGELTDLIKEISYAAMKQWANNNGYTITADMDKYFQDKSDQWSTEQIHSIPTMKAEIEQNLGKWSTTWEDKTNTGGGLGLSPSGQYYSLNDKQIEELIVRGKYSPSVAAETRKVRRKLTDEEIQAIDSGEADYLKKVMETAPKMEDFSTEKQLLEATVKYYQDVYDKYNQKAVESQKTNTVSRNVSDQYGIAGATYYEQAQKKLADINAGKVKGDWNLKGSGNKWIIEDAAKKISPMYEEDPNKLISFSHEYMADQFNPKYSRMTMEEKLALTNTALDTGYGNNGAGLISGTNPNTSVDATTKLPVNKTKEETDENFRKLVEKARLASATPQRKVKI
jgi:hypothetical protein